MGSPEAMHFMDTVSPFFATIKPFLGVLEISGGALAKDKLTNIHKSSEMMLKDQYCVIINNT